MQSAYNKTKRSSHVYKEGDKVMLDTRNLNLHCPSKKLSEKRLGPFEVLEKVGQSAYHLKLPLSWKIHPVVHATLLSPFRENDIHGPNYPSPPPDLIEGEHEYEVEAIIAHKRQGRGHVYLVKWKGYPTSDNSWEPERNMTNSAAILNSYKRKHNIA